MLFKGKQYKYENLKLGQKVYPSQLVMCSVDCKVKIGYPNGDHFYIAPGTMLEVPVNTGKKGDKSSGETKMELVYGKVRAVVSHEGPHNNLKVKTNTAVAGVRGTDFFIAHQESTGTALSVVRGKVEFTEKAKKSVNVESGQVVTPKGTRALYKDEITDIYRVSKVEEPTSQQVNALPKEEQESLKQANDNSVVVIKKDIERYQPNLAASTEKAKSANELNAAALLSLYKSATPGKSAWELEKQKSGNISDELYKKYFE
jgi:hypothetical protein